MTILASRHFRAACWLITTKTLVLGWTHLTQSFSFIKPGKLCTTHFICGNVVLSQRLTDPILTDVVARQFRAAYWLITTKLIHMSWYGILQRFGYPKSLHIRATRDWDIPSKLRFDAIYPSVAILASRQFRAAYWLITTKTLVVGWTHLTQSFSVLKDREIMYHSLYMWKSCSEPTPYGSHIDWRGVTSVQGGILAD